MLNIQPSTINGRHKFKRALYRASLIFFISLFVAACSLLPIDTLFQSTMNKQSSGNLAVNTIIVIVCCVAAIVTAAVFATYRFFKFYMLLADIPKKYVPIHLSDFTDKAYYEYIAENTKKCQMIYHESNKPKQPIEHDGLSNPIKEESIIPSSLVYEDVVRSVGDRARMINEVKFGLLSFRELITIHGNDGAKVVKIYEKLRFSNKAISQEEFVELLVEFVKLYR